MSAFDDLVNANNRHVERFDLATTKAVPRQRLAVVTCMDCRIDPLAIFDFEVGDIHVMRNAGARITDDVLRSLVKSVNQLEVERIAIVHHTDCGAGKITLPQLRARVVATTGNDPSEVHFHLIDDPDAALASDVAAVTRYPYLPVGTLVAGFMYEVTTGVATLRHTAVVS